ncbi:hypothetical protein Clacol_005607 [Clathrus columnatus]|uniref:UBC core domain-containing protein n=1 Tax=Clathrus columnatus TaxID=1419009 RepID=A0AAV5AEQ1_9AGAM|nr:hypothetical protein Clacol_005607 [Clathrus columnatus]
MATKAATKRLSKEYATMQKEPPPFVWAVPDEKNILTCFSGNYIIRGPPDSPYAGGEYHGVLLFPAEYPFKPPGIKSFASHLVLLALDVDSLWPFPTGQKNLLLNWNPAWSVATILTGLLSFMLSDEMTTGGLLSNPHDKRILASRSHAWNITQKRFKDAFPEYCTPTPKDLPNMGERERGIPDERQRTTPGTEAIVPNSIPLGTASQDETLGGSDKQIAQNAPNANAHGAFGTFALGWRNLIWEKWRWGAVIAIAVLVSRLSSN